MAMRREVVGFTLIELMIVVAVVAILAAIAVPAYNEQVRKSRRSDAIAAVGQVQLAMERWRADNPTYANPTAAATYPALPTSPFYTYALTNQSATAYTITATPAGGQVGDRCGVLTGSQNLTTKPQWATAACN